MHRGSSHCSSTMVVRSRSRVMVRKRLVMVRLALVVHIRHKAAVGVNVVGNVLCAAVRQCHCVGTVNVA